MTRIREPRPSSSRLRALSDRGVPLSTPMAAAVPIGGGAEESPDRRLSSCSRSGLPAPSEPWGMLGKHVAEDLGAQARVCGPPPRLGAPSGAARRVHPPSGSPRTGSRRRPPSHQLQPLFYRAGARGTGLGHGAQRGTQTGGRRLARRLPRDVRSPPPPPDERGLHPRAVEVRELNGARVQLAPRPVDDTSCSH